MSETTNNQQSDLKEDQSEPSLSSIAQNELFEKYEWMIRPCKVYKDEYKDCKSIRGRFHQYFIYGEYLSCDQWRDDYKNCQKWSWLKNKDAAKAIIQSDLKRKAERIKAHLDNTIWTKRKEPPEDWAKPLPDWMEKRNENTYLSVKAKELKEEEELQLKQATETKQEMVSNNSSNNNNNSLKSSFCAFM